MRWAVITITHDGVVVYVRAGCSGGDVARFTKQRAKEMRDQIADAYGDEVQVVAICRYPRKIR